MSGKTFWTMVLMELAVLAGLGLWWARKKSSPLPGDAAQVAQIRSSQPYDLPADAIIMTPVNEQAPPPPPQVDLRDRQLPALSRPVIVVEKAARRLTVFDHGRAVKQYAAAVGGDGRDKVREGDCRTPEGKFYVCAKLGQGESAYTRGLRLSYPTVEDARRGLGSNLIGRRQYDEIVQAILEGRQPPQNTDLGGMITIHGRRLGGRDTLGCVALEDPDILELFPQIPLGTTVIIKP